MAQLLIRNLTRQFPSGGGVANVSLAVERGQFLVLLGPSGCGKSTLLRLIAGLEHPDSGEIEIDGVNQARDGSHRDSVAMVFQNFALYPHMTAFQNIAFPLRLRRTPSDEIGRRVKESASKAGLDLDLNRYPRELSGGERQRVALARAMVREPEIVLMDEALSSLDTQLRLTLRTELKAFQRRTGRTFVYVTHDQAEALALADTLAVMRNGTIEQTGTPEKVFNHPATEFVARFLGTPPMNLFPSNVVPGGIEIAGAIIDLPLPIDAQQSTIVGIRPHDLTLDPIAGCLSIDVLIDSAEYSGNNFILYAHHNELRLIAEVPRRVDPGSTHRFYFSKDRLHFFNATTGARLNIQALRLPVT